MFNEVFGDLTGVTRDDGPWAPVSFDQLADGTSYLYMSGRVAPVSAEPPGQDRPAVTRGWSRQAGMVAM